ncbi:MAG: prolyl oligopeptidase family serine peptidase [Cyanobacteriota/Melainabacteria group bacterium]
MTYQKRIAPFGTWASPIKADDIAGGTLRLGQLLVDSGSIYWLEGRPKEGGRVGLMRRRPDGVLEDLLPEPYNVRTLVHEYGGCAFLPSKNLVFFTNYSDQCIYLLDLDAASHPKPHPNSKQSCIQITAAGPYRYADMVLDETRRKLYCIVEQHAAEGDNVHKEPENYVASIDIGALFDGADSLASFKPVAPEVVAGGKDFYAYPRLSPDGKSLSYISWSHPNMPWDGTVLMLASLNEDGHIAKEAAIAGGEEESIFQPIWSHDGVLHYVSDRTGFWNIYRHLGQGKSDVNLTPYQKEFGMPLWVFNMSTYAFLQSGEIIAACSDKGLWKLGRVSLDDSGQGSYNEIECPYTDIHYLFSDGKEVGMLASSPVSASAVMRYDPSADSFEEVKSSSSLDIDLGYISRPEVIEFPTTGGKTAYAFYYPPANKDFEAPQTELPPLLVKSHGGPTGGTGTGLNPGFQYWTSRGYAVVDVNYGGSTGYGREYMKRLERNWGVVDVDDCENAALYLVQKGLADRKRLAITGGSAGGYTTLCVLTFKDSFSAGASHYGIGDLELLAKDTHKFESRYCDRLVGPYPEEKDLYMERSPLHYTDKLSCPLIVFQGLEDKVVPPNQAEAMVEAVKAKDLPVAYIAYEGEQHGFRKAENIKRTIEAEFYFFAKIFGFEPADKIEPVEISNFEGASALK